MVRNAAFRTSFGAVHVAEEMGSPPMPVRPGAGDRAAGPGTPASADRRNAASWLIVPLLAGLLIVGFICNFMVKSLEDRHYTENAPVAA